MAGEAPWAIERDLGQRAGAPGRGRQGISADAWAGAAVGEPPFSRGQALQGYSPDFNADEAVWGWAREEATGNLCLGTKALVQERVGNFLGGWPAGEMKSNGAAGPSCNQGPRDSRETSSPIPQDLEMHIPPWL